MVKSGIDPMASATYDGVSPVFGGRTMAAAICAGAKLMGLARRLTDALAAQRRREVDREIARLLAQSGGRLTDSLEREIMRMSLASGWSE